MDCPGCGLQRSLIALFKGNLLQSFKLYPATIPFVVLILFVLVHLKVDFKFGAGFIKVMYIFIALLVMVNYIYKIYNHQLYS